MIGYLRGSISHIFLDSCYIDVNGIGYRVYISETTRLQLMEGERVQLYTYLNVREDAMQLFGFLTEAEYDLFVLLISVSGIGPKVGMGILSGMAPETIRLAIASENIPMLVKLPGIGKKSAERLVLELKDKIGDIPLGDFGGKLPGQKVTHVEKGPQGEALEALKSLGYSEGEVASLVETLSEGEKDVSKIIRSVLAELGKKR